MSDAKPLTLSDVTQAVRDTRCSPSFADEVRATVEALEKADEKWRRALDDALEQLRQEEHQRTTAERLAEKAEAEVERLRKLWSPDLDTRWRGLVFDHETERRARQKAEAALDLEEHYRSEAVRLLEKAEAERAAIYSALSEAGISHGGTVEGLKQGLSVVASIRSERDEARAEVARLQDLHTRCAAFDDQPGPSCVTLKAEVARLREALEVALTQGWNGQHSSLCFSGEPYTGCTCPPWVQQARTALAVDVDVARLLDSDDPEAAWTKGNIP